LFEHPSHIIPFPSSPTIYDCLLKVRNDSIKEALSNKLAILVVVNGEALQIGVEERHAQEQGGVNKMGRVGTFS
jgi:hypothetical protein